MNYELKRLPSNRKQEWKVRCPQCRKWYYLDDEQFFGKAFVVCGCGFHKIINFDDIIKKDNNQN